MQLATLPACFPHSTWPTLPPLTVNTHKPLALIFARVVHCDAANNKCGGGGGGDGDGSGNGGSFVPFGQRAAVLDYLLLTAS